MAILTGTLKTLILSFFLIHPILGHDKAAIKSWCGRTPNPGPCEHFLTETAEYDAVPLRNEPDFFRLSTKLALDRCIHAETGLSSLGSKCRSTREKAAWSDCVELYEEAIQRINITADPHVRCTADDAQTWLSAALTNLDTCRQGFKEFGISDFPLPPNNVSQLLGNALALNGKVAAEFGGTRSSTGGFPEWVKPGDRRLLQTTGVPKADAVVAQDGSGGYRTVGAAVAAAGKRSGSQRYVIYVKQGMYKENVEIAKGVKNIMLVGDGIGKTIITGSRSVGGGSTTFKSATFAVVGDGFIGQGITFRNTAGAANHQAVAVRSGSDLSVFYQCSFEGYQDTLYVYSQRQFYRDCDVYGTVDFIFGNAAAVLQNCNIYARDPPNRINTVTAQGRTDPNQNTGISIHNCRVTAAPDLQASPTGVRTYLGRPWKQYSRTVVMKTFLDRLIDPAGWLPWSGTFALNTLYYGEYANTGPGSSTANRVQWKGYHVITSAAEAAKFTPGTFIAAGSWLPATGVPFTSGL